MFNRGRKASEKSPKQSKSFANNKNLSLQIRFVLAIGSETEGSTGFTFFNNIIYTSSTKCKRVTRAVLASELYIIIARVNMLIFLATTTNIVTDKLGFPKLPTVIGGDHNPANIIIKATLNKSLQQLINTNKLTVKVEGWV
ncbi:hypothetical protein DL98DRAFT_555054 [Cadophora sp. DSE1049]|nr:hypothetical protein DL98DRAFT_555054 [Cadophora sp. DSE1049]